MSSFKERLTVLVAHAPSDGGCVIHHTRCTVQPAILMAQLEFASELAGLRNGGAMAYSAELEFAAGAEDGLV